MKGSGVRIAESEDGEMCRNGASDVQIGWLIRCELCVEEGDFKKDATICWPVKWHAKSG
jgi:hypothetical protein